MLNRKSLRFGPHTLKVERLLNWISEGELLRFGKPLSGGFIPVSDFQEALAIAQGDRSNSINWVEVRENADASLYEVGLLDATPWSQYKPGIKSLLSLIADEVAMVFPKDCPGILDDVIGDIHSCAICLAVHGKLNDFHSHLWEAYTCGGWPCGCTGEEPEPPEYVFHLDDRKFYVYWKGGMVAFGNDAHIPNSGAEPFPLLA